MTTSLLTRTVVFHELGGPDVLTVEELELPPPGLGEVLFRVDAIGLNRAEALFRAGTYFYPATLPGSRLGYEAAGVVEAVGDGVTQFVPGDLVLSAANFDFGTHGVYTERALLPADSLVRRPVGVDAVTAAAVWLTYSTAYGALVETAGMRAGDHVLVTGASSGVGTAAIQTAVRLGAVPIATTRTRAKREELLKLGAAHVVVSDEEDVVKEVRRITGDRGVDIAFDAIGGPGFRTLGEAVASGGSLVLYGWLDPHPAELPMAWPLTVHLYNNLAMTGSPDGRRRAERFIGAGLAGGELRPVIGKVFDGLERMADAHHLMESNAHTGKIVVRVAAAKSSPSGV